MGLQPLQSITADLDNDFIPSSYKTAIQVVTKCALVPLSTTDEDFEVLRDEGFSDREIQELMAQAELANILITIAEISGIEIDQEFFLAFHNAPSQSGADFWRSKPLYTHNYPSLQDEMRTNRPRYSVVEYEEATHEVRAIYDEIMNVTGMPFVLNISKCQGGVLHLLKGGWEKIKVTLYGGEIPMLLKQLIMYNVSKSRNCKYCTFLHKIIADSLSSLLYDGEGFQVTEHLQSDLIPSSYSTAIEIVSRWALTPSLTTDEDFEALRDEGFSDREIQELMSIADLINMLNTTADIFGIEIDPELFVGL